MRTLTLIAAIAALTVSAAAEEAARGYLGVRVEPLDEALRERFSIPESIKEGFVLVFIEEKSAAQRAGLRPGDVLVQVDGKPATSVEQLVEVISSKKPGDKLGYSVLRGSGSMTGWLKLGERPEVAEAPAREIKEIEAVVRKMRADEEGADVERRMDRVERSLDEIRRHLLEKRKHARPERKPRSVAGWLERERKAMHRAHESGNEKATHFHRARLSVLEEMREAGVKGAEGGGVPAKRLARLEKKLDQILKLLKSER